MVSLDQINLPSLVSIKSPVEPLRPAIAWNTFVAVVAVVVTSTSWK